MQLKFNGISRAKLPKVSNLNNINWDIYSDEYLLKCIYDEASKKVSNKEWTEEDFSSFITGINTVRKELVIENYSEIMSLLLQNKFELENKIREVCIDLGISLFTYRGKDDVITRSFNLGDIALFIRELEGRLNQQVKSCSFNKNLDPCNPDTSSREEAEELLITLKDPDSGMQDALLEKFNRYFRLALDMPEIKEMIIRKRNQIIKGNIRNLENIINIYEDKKNRIIDSAFIESVVRVKKGNVQKKILD